MLSPHCIAALPASSCCAFAAEGYKQMPYALRSAEIVRPVQGWPRYVSKHPMVERCGDAQEWELCGSDIGRQRKRAAYERRLHRSHDMMGVHARSGKSAVAVPARIRS